MYTRFFLETAIFLICTINFLDCSQNQRTTEQTLQDCTKYSLFFVDVDKKVTIAQDKIAVRRAGFAKLEKSIDGRPDLAVIELQCKDGRCIQSFPELGFIDIFHADNSLETIYVDDNKFNSSARQVIYCDGFRKIFLRDGSYATKMPCDERWMFSYHVRKGLYDGRLNSYIAKMQKK
jgi:hypothetical protein